jgi:ABC-type glycerol-3-phosphate transport system substrate-binding protein
MLKCNWDVVMFPKGPKGIRGFATGGSGYAITSATEHPQEAWEVVKCLAGDEGQEKLADTGLAQPANRKIAEGIHFAQGSAAPLNKGMLNEAVKYVVYDPFHIRWREAQDKYITPKLDLINSGKISVEEGFKKIVPRVNILLQEKE